MTSFLVGPITVVSLLVLVYTALQFQSKGWRVAAALLWMTVLHEAVLVVFPILHSVFTNFELDSVVSAGPTDLLLVMIGEALFVSLFCATLLFGLRSTAKVRSVYRISSLSKQMLYGLVISMLAIGIYGIASPVQDFQQTIHHADYAPTSIVGMLFQWMMGFVERPGIVAASVVVTGASYSRIFRLASGTALFLLAMGGVAEGIRGRAIWVVCMLLLMSLIRRSWKPAIVSTIILAIVVPLSVFLSGAYRSIMFSMNPGTTRVAAVIDLAQMADGEVVERDDQSFLDNLAHRAQGPRNSVVLMRLHDNGEGGSYKPLLSALYTPIPRILWPEKSPAGSTDSTNYGAAIFLVRRLGYGAPIYNMGPILASSHAYWEGGWFWLVGCAILSGAVWFYILAWCRRKLLDDFDTTLAITFLMALPIDGLFTMLSPLYAMIGLFWSAIFPVLLFRWALRRILNPRRRTSVATVS